MAVRLTNAYGETLTADARDLLRALGGMAFIECVHIVLNTPLHPVALEKVDVFNDQRVQINHHRLC